MPKGLGYLGLRDDFHDVDTDFLKSLSEKLQSLELVRAILNLTFSKPEKIIKKPVDNGFKWTEAILRRFDVRHPLIGNA